MKTTKLLRWLCLSGLPAVIFYFLHVFYGQQAYPGYLSMEQAISD